MTSYQVFATVAYVATLGLGGCGAIISMTSTDKPSQALGLVLAALAWFAAYALLETAL